MTVSFGLMLQCFSVRFSMLTELPKIRLVSERALLVTQTQSSNIPTEQLSQAAVRMIYYQLRA